MKDEVIAITSDEYESTETHWIHLHVNGDNVTYFHSFGVECIPKEVKNFLAIKNIRANTFDIQKK